LASKRSIDGDAARRPATFSQSDAHSRSFWIDSRIRLAVAAREGAIGRDGGMVEPGTLRRVMPP
jgi:hypothetical protein